MISTIGDGSNRESISNEVIEKLVRSKQERQGAGVVHGWMGRAMRGEERRGEKGREGKGREKR